MTKKRNAPDRTVADINTHNREFWQEVQNKVDRAMEDSLTIDAALDDMHEQVRDRGLSNTKSLESHLLKQHGRAVQRKAQFEAQHGADIELAQQYRSNQKQKAGKPRTTIETGDGDRTSISEVIGALARERDGLGDFLSPKELWPRFIAKLDDAKLKPKEEDGGVFYGDEDERRNITKDSFRAALSRKRRNS